MTTINTTANMAEEIVEIYNNSNEIFGISGNRILPSRGNARVKKSEADYLLKFHGHAIHRKFIEQDDTVSKLATERDRMAKELEDAKAELAKYKNSIGEDSNLKTKKRKGGIEESETEAKEEVIEENKI